MPLPRVVAVADGSAAAAAGLLVGDEIRSLNGRLPRDVIEYRLLADEASLELEVARGGLARTVRVEKSAGEPLGVEVASPVFDRVRTCDNHCAFCFIYQLPKGLRRSLYVKDDDYRLSFLYGNFTTLTRFTELDLERVVGERLSPINVSIHSTDPGLRARMLRNRRGAMSLRWLRQLLDHGIEVHGQVVVCPGVNDGIALEETFAGVLERFPELASLCVVPLGVSRYSKEAEMRPHTAAEAEAVCDAVGEWQGRFAAALGRRLVQAADEYYLLAGRELPEAASYEGFDQHENGVGMVRAFEAGFLARTARRSEPAGEGTASATPSPGGFFRSVDGAPAYGYRAERLQGGTGAGGGRGGALGRVEARSPGGGEAGRRVVVLSGDYGARVLRPLLQGAGFGTVEVVAVRNEFFGGNIAVTGLLTGSDVGRVLARMPVQGRYLLPDVCLSEGRFLDGVRLDELPRPVEVVASDGAALRRVLDGAAGRGPVAGPRRQPSASASAPAPPLAPPAVPLATPAGGRRRPSPAPA